MSIINNTMSSREIADLTNKQHKDVLEAIRNMEGAWEKVNGRKFPLVEYRDAKGEKRPMYQLSKTECLYVATKFNDEARAKLILRWEELENSKSTIAPNRKQLALMVIEAEEEIEKLTLINNSQKKEIQILAPKAELMDKVLDSDKLIDIGQAAKILQLPIGRNKLFENLRNQGIFFKNKNEPKQEYIEKGFFLLKEKFIERKNHEGLVVIKILVTQRGLQFLSKLFQAKPAQIQLACFE